MKLIDDLCVIVKERIDLLAGNYENLQRSLYFSLLIDKNNINKLSSIYNYVSNTESRYKFSLTFSLSVVDLSNIEANDLVAFFFLPNYKTLNNKPIVNFILHSDENYEIVQNLFNKLSDEQRFEGIFCNRLSSHNYYDYTVNTSLTGNFSHVALRFIIFERDWVNEKNIFVGAVINTSENIHDFVEHIDVYENEFQQSNPLFYSLLLEKKKLIIEVYEFKDEVKYLEESLKNEKTYNAFLKNNHQAKLLQAYYDREYEVLPTWFKRLGHIIKIITGKRRLRL